MADFKKDFANHINVIGTNPYLFIGSGLSRRYLNMPTWLNLLKDFSEKLLLQKGFGYYDSKSEGNLPELASLMASEFHETWWTNPAFSDSRKEYENKRIGSQEIPFKIELSKFVSNHKDFQEDYSEEIELLKAYFKLKKNVNKKYDSVKEKYMNAKELLNGIKFWEKYLNINSNWK